MSLVSIAPLFIQLTDNSICFLNHVLHSFPLPSANYPSEMLYILTVKLLSSLVYSVLLNNVLSVALSMKFIRSGLRDHLFKPSVCFICFLLTASFHCVYNCFVSSKVSFIIKGGNKHFPKLVSAAYCNSSKEGIQFYYLTMFDLNHFNCMVYCLDILLHIRTFRSYMLRIGGAFW
jgi:hypothetical protein